MSFPDLTKKFDKHTEAVYTESIGENMDEHTEIIFNLFILAFMDRSVDLYMSVYDTEYDKYMAFMEYEPFIKIKDCFPENEIACQTLVSGDYEIDFPCNLIHEKDTRVKVRSSKTNKKMIEALKTVGNAKYNKKTRNWEL